jgi:DNA-binding beta-propeller fold protein YncE
VNHLLKAGVVFAATVLALCAAAEPAANPFVVVQRIAGPDGAWDLAAVDAAARRLYVGRGYGVMAVDLATGKVTDKLVEGAGVHGVLPIPGSALVASANGRSNEAILFDGVSGKVEATIPTGASPDALLVEPKSGLLAIFNAKSKDATLYDRAARAVVGVVALGGKPEAAAADESGRVFVNLEDKSEIAIVDVAARKTTGAYPLPGCEGPTGLARDAALGVLISACANQVAKVIDEKSGKDLATLAICKKPDGVMLDARRRRAFIPCADGSLMVLALSAPQDVKVAATVQTQAGAKTGALDPETGRLYLPTAKFAPAESEGARPKPLPGTFEILVVSETK